MSKKKKTAPAQQDNSSIFEDKDGDVATLEESEVRPPVNLKWTSSSKNKKITKKAIAVWINPSLELLYVVDPNAKCWEINKDGEVKEIDKYWLNSAVAHSEDFNGFNYDEWLAKKSAEEFSVPDVERDYYAEVCDEHGIEWRQKPRKPPTVEELVRGSVK